jgi:hypothetical protein
MIDIMLEQLHEGRMKDMFTDKVEKACNCEELGDNFDGGACLDPDEHYPKCKAQKYLKDFDNSDEMDKAEYNRGDR